MVADDYTVGEIAKLTRLWLAPGAEPGTYAHSGAEIGRIMGRSKNAVVGKAHRLGLPPRPSPLGDGSKGYKKEGRPPKPKAPKVTLPPIASVESAPEPVAVVPPSPPPKPKPYGRIVTCCWPIGEPGSRSFRFCDAASEPGRPYCPDHVKLAYVRLRDRREDAA